MPEFDQVWRSNPEKTKSQFLEQEPNCQELCGEVEHILKKKLKNSGIEIATISSRAKTWKSFWEKIEKKEYANPFEEVSDFSGARVVHLYAQDTDKIEEIIRNEFEILEIVNKIDKNGESRFGYSAVHFIVKLNGNTSGARYDELKSLRCEIQVRTVLQDAWAIIEHHLGYKSVIPSALKRKLNGLAGLLEVADDQFEQVRIARAAYIDKVSNSKENPQNFLKTELNLDTFFEYLKWKYHDEFVSAESTSYIFDFVLDLKYDKLAELDHDVGIGQKIAKKLNSSDLDELNIYFNRSDLQFMMHLYLANPKFAIYINVTTSIVKLLNLHRVK
jgi:putative GTP pyrophosphokinase